MDTLIVTNGMITHTHYLRSLAKQHGLLICADGAVRYLRAEDVVPSYVVGDMDSIRDEDMKWLKEKSVSVKQYDTRKDYTDTELAIRHAIKDGSRRITLTGALGGRIDHCMGNIYLLALIQQLEAEGRIVEWDVEMMILTNHLNMEWCVGETVSLVPVSEMVNGVSLNGFEYPLIDETLLLGHTRSLSNKVSEAKQSIRVEKGKLLVIRNK